MLAGWRVVVFRRFLVVTVLGAAGSIALLGGQAGAIWWSTTLPAIVTPSSSLALGGSCVPDYVAAGVGSSNGLNYTMQGYGFSTVSTPATQVGCRFWDTVTDAPLGTWESGFKPGPLAALAVNFTVGTLDDLVTCIKVDRLDRTTGEVYSTGWTSTDGSYCG
jgi:hypothetical protein